MGENLATANTICTGNIPAWEKQYRNSLLTIIKEINNE